MDDTALSAHTPTILEQNEDRTDVHVSCSCGEWEFRGDWDEMAVAWFGHERHPDYEYLYVGRSSQMFFTRAGEQAIAEIIERRRRSNDDAASS